MTENKRLVQGSYGEQRYLHSDEIFRKERNWNMNLPSNREFKNGYCIITDKDNTAYSIDELVELLNEFQKENEQLKLKNKGLKSELTILKTDIQHSTMIINELHDKNKQIKKELDYIQNSITNAIKHQKTELGQKALQEIIQDYNEWMLGHKEAKE